MSDRVRRAPSAAVATALAGLWALLLVLLAGSAAAPTAAAATSPPGSTASVGTSVPSPSTAPVAGLNGRVQTRIEPTDTHPAVNDRSRVSTPDAHAVVHSQRPHGLPVMTQGPVTGPLRLPLRAGEIVGPRQERAPPPAVLTSRRTRGPPFVRSS
ncbi:hypothetical protein [Streptomyces netropsis]|uniref:Secreted protein n=1 Tax=Streptomyces netropsis TaxID=55404 RepID=A0A7W7LE08_STRNE|nr:hypothetical protein [Streptomyces netropsis]MBB4887911.1 hypothetical protein [Streptomyces netropsis]